MEEKNLNAISPEVVHPENTDANAQEVVHPENNGAAAENPPTGEPTNPRNVEDMSDDEFEEYLKQAQNGTVPTPPVPAAENEDNPENPGVATPAEGNPNLENKPFRVFNTQEEFQSEFDRIMGDRLKTHRADMDILDRLKVQARHFYTDAADDNAAVMELINDLMQQNADKQGIGVEEFSKQMQDAEDAQRYRAAQQAEREQQARIAAVHNRWREESESLKAIVPDFDFQKALENKIFYSAIEGGKSVAEAYMIASREAQSAAEKQKPKREPITQVGNQRGTAPGQVQFDPMKLNDEEFDKWVAKKMNG